MPTATKTRKLQRKTFSFNSSDPIIEYIQKLQGIKFKANSEAEIIKFGISRLVEDLESDIQHKDYKYMGDMSDEEAEKRGWESISTQELIERHPKYKKEFEEAVIDMEKVKTGKAKAVSHEEVIKLLAAKIKS